MTIDLKTNERTALEEAADIALKVAALAYAHAVNNERDGEAPQATAEYARLLRGRRFGHELPAFLDENPPLDMRAEADALASAPQAAIAGAITWGEVHARADWFVTTVQFLLGTYEAVDKTGETRRIEAIPTSYGWHGSTNNNDTADNGREDHAS